MGVGGLTNACQERRRERLYFQKKRHKQGEGGGGGQEEKDAGRKFESVIRLTNNSIICDYCV